MKTIHKSLMALAASLLLVPAAFSQTSSQVTDAGAYLVDETTGFGFNKYLKDKTPNAQGEYMLRIENFAMGEVKVETKVVPSDIVLVLDMSGSMLEDYVNATKTLAEQLIQDVGSLTNPSGGATYDPGNYDQSTGKSANNARVQNLTNFGQSSTTSSTICTSTYHRFIKVGDDYYQVNRGMVKKTVDGTTSYYCYLYFTDKNNQQYYLFGKESDADKGIHAITGNNNQNIPTDHMYTGRTATWRGQLYRYSTRLEALRNAVQSFITAIAENDRDEVKPNLKSADEVGNRISIVKFAGNGYFSGWPNGATDSLVTPSSSVLSAALVERNNKAESSVVMKFKTLTNGYGDNVTLDTENITALQNTMAWSGGMVANSNTPIDCGANLARLLFLDATANGLPAVDNSGKVTLRNRTVVFFTDGDPVKSGNGFCQITHDALGYGTVLKKTGAGNINSKIFTIGLNPSSSSLPFLKYLSSNWSWSQQTVNTNSSASYAHYIGEQIPAYDEEHDPEHTAPKRIFYSDAATTDISKIFEAIAEYSGGGASSASSSSLTAIDIVSSSFTLPKNVDVSRIKVYTAPCVGTTGETWTDSEGVDHDVLAFADLEKDEILANDGSDGRDPVGVIWVARVDDEGNPVLDPDTHEQIWDKKTNYDIDANITVTIDKTNNTVNVGGFKYGELWCGHDADPDHNNSLEFDADDYPTTYQPGYRGFKLIIEFPIVVKDGALGGANVPTNEEGSGLYQVDDQGNIIGRLFEYPQPELPIPVNLWIEKRGLKPGESATFTIMKKPIDGSTDEYVPFTRVNIIGSADGTPVIAKLLNLDPTFFYKIWEEGWAWTYSNQAQDQATAPTTEDPTVTNPIVIENTYEEPDAKTAEAVVRNEMKKKTN